MQTSTFTIPTQRVPDFVKKFERIQRKADKIGGLVSYTLGDITQDEVTYWVRNDFGQEVPRRGIFEVQEVTVQGDAPVIEGWEVIAVIDHTTAQAGSPFNLVHDLGVGSSAERFRTVSNDCDHCGWDRNRKTTVIVRHVDTREQKQVGLGCLADFTGSNDPHHAARLCTYLVEAQGSGEEFTSLQGVTPLIDKEGFLATTAAVIRESGWVSKGQADWGKTATVEHVKAILFGIKDDKFFQVDVTADDHKKAQDALDWIEFEADTSNDFISKLHAVLSGRGLHFKHLGIAAALFVAYDKAQEKQVRQAAQEAAKASSDHVGVEGERLEFVVTVTGRHEYQKRTFSYYDTDRGIILSFTDDQGNVLKWFTTPVPASKFTDGERYRVAGTVKSHGEFRGVAETVVNRVSIREELS